MKSVWQSRRLVRKPLISHEDVKLHCIAEVKREAIRLVHLLLGSCNIRIVFNFQFRVQVVGGAIKSMVFYGLVF